MIVTTTELFKHAYGNYAIGAYNINNLEQTVGLFRGNLGKVKSNDEPVDPSVAAPFILQISRGARAYRDLSRGHLCRASGPRHRRSLLRLHRQRVLQLGDDRRLARAVREERGDHPARGRTRS